MDYTIEQFELLLKKYTRLRDNLDPKSIRSQIYGEIYNEIIDDAKKGIARAKSRNESSGLHKHVVKRSFKFDYKFGHLSKNMYRHFPMLYFAYGKNGFSLCLLGATITCKLW